MTEIAKSFWDNLDKTITYSKKTNTDSNADILRKYGSVSTIFGYAIILYFLIGQEIYLVNMLYLLMELVEM